MAAVASQAAGDGGSDCQPGGVGNRSLWKILLQLLVPFAAGHSLCPWIGEWVDRNRASVRREAVENPVAGLGGFCDVGVDGPRRHQSCQAVIVCNTAKGAVP